jgi:hypothetical protein
MEQPLRLIRAGEHDQEMAIQMTPIIANFRSVPKTLCLLPPCEEEDESTGEENEEKEQRLMESGEPRAPGPTIFLLRLSHTKAQLLFPVQTVHDFEDCQIWPDSDLRPSSILMDFAARIVSPLAGRSVMGHLRERWLFGNPLQKPFACNPP